MPFEYKAIPWDSVLFGKPVLEILNSSEYRENLQLSFRDMEQQLVEQNQPFMIFTKIPATNIKKIHIFEQNGFEYIETQFHIVKKISRLYEINFDLFYDRVNQTDLPQILNIARKSFDTDRYSIDPYIGKEKSGERYSNWVNNSFRDPNYLIYKYTYDREIVGFHMLEIKEKTAYALLGGVNPHCKGTGLGLYINLMFNNILYHQGTSYIDTHISAINLDIFNIDIYMEYKIKDVQIVLRKIYPDNF